MTFRHRVVQTQFYALGVVEFALLLRDVLRDVHENGSGPAGLRDMKRFLDGRRELANVLDQVVMLDAGTRDADRIALLERILADRMRRHLSADDDHGDRIHVRRRNAGHGIGDARSRGDQRYADFLAGSGIAVGGVDRALLMPDQHMLYLVLLEKLIVDIQYGAARIAEHIFDFFQGEAAQDYLRARQDFFRHNDTSVAVC